MGRKRRTKVRKGGGRVKGAHLGGDAAGHDLEDFDAEQDEEFVDAGGRTGVGVATGHLLLGVGHRLVHQVRVLRQRRRRQQQARVGRRVRRLVFDHGWTKSTPSSITPKCLPFHRRWPTECRLKR